MRSGLNLAREAKDEEMDGERYPAMYIDTGPGVDEGRNNEVDVERNEKDFCPH